MRTRGSNNDADSIVMDKGRSYIIKLGDKLLLLLCLNDNEFNVVEVDKLLVEDIANMLLKRPPALHLVRGEVHPANDVYNIVSIVLVKSMSFLSLSLLSLRGGGGGREVRASMGGNHQGRLGEEGSNGTNKKGRSNEDNKDNIVSINIRVLHLGG
jgi:hypothetical protein